jgi:formylglycine-generating enzyme
MRIITNLIFLIVIITAFLFFNCSQSSNEGNKSITQIIEDQTGLINMVQVSEINNFPMGFSVISIPVHSVPLISKFKIGKYEVTYEEWRIVRTWALANGYSFANPGREGNDGVAGANPTTARNEPVTTINWRDAIVWCNAASQYDGFTPVYYTNSSFTAILKSSTNGIYGTSINFTAGSFDNPYVNWPANGYRLPTEAEWEAAARFQNGTVWTAGNFASGATASYINAAATGEAAWYTVNSGAVSHDAGTKNPNQLFIYDMTGNVWEWCWDWYGVYTTLSPFTDNNPKGLSSGTLRTSRGAGFLDLAVDSTISFRGMNDPFSSTNTDQGMRVVRSY